ncbi:MAG: type 1 glutamine amidotransferase [Zetaproteobacteria bacterium]|nr:MAG: type 1 glutamine amidotransferase [Zetaproteobacteria bacterium]
MRVHYLQHVPFEGLGAIADWLTHHGMDATCTRFYAGDTLPSPQAVDFLIVMGGPMSVHDHDRFPWLDEEKRFVRDYLAQRRPLLGICLGAQLIAEAMGAKVYPMPHREIGWHPVQRTAQRDARFPLPATFTAFHWHGETFTLPAGAKRLAASAACPQQAFRVGDHVLALQCHLETTPSAARALVRHCAHDLLPGPYVQAAPSILAASNQVYAAMHQHLFALLDGLSDARKA